MKVTPHIEANCCCCTFRLCEERQARQVYLQIVFKEHRFVAIRGDEALYDHLRTKQACNLHCMSLAGGRWGKLLLRVLCLWFCAFSGVSCVG